MDLSQLDTFLRTLREPFPGEHSTKADCILGYAAVERYVAKLFDDLETILTGVFRYHREGTLIIMMKLLEI